MDKLTAIGVLLGYLEDYIEEFGIGDDDKAGTRETQRKALYTLGVTAEEIERVENGAF